MQHFQKYADVVHCPGTKLHSLLAVKAASKEYIGGGYDPTSCMGREQTEIKDDAGALASGK